MDGYHGASQIHGVSGILRIRNSCVTLTLKTSMTGHFLGWWWLGSDAFQTSLSVQHCEYLVFHFCRPLSNPHNNVNTILFVCVCLLRAVRMASFFGCPDGSSKFSPSVETESDFWGLWSSVLNSTLPKAAVKYHNFNNCLWFLSNHFPMLYWKFSYVILKAFILLIITAVSLLLVNVSYFPI